MDKRLRGDVRQSFECDVPPLPAAFRGIQIEPGFLGALLAVRCCLVGRAPPGPCQGLGWRGTGVCSGPGDTGAPPNLVGVPVSVASGVGVDSGEIGVSVDSGEIGVPVASVGISVGVTTMDQLSVVWQREHWPRA